MNILVVDDEILQLKSIKIGLRTEGYSVATAQSGEEALQLLELAPKPFDLIITDYFMPNFNGLELLQEVKKRRAFIPVILMTAYGRKNLVIEALKQECSGFVEKPFDLDQLLAEIKRVLDCETRNDRSTDNDKTLAEIVHQINNPLMAIVGTAHVALHLNGDASSMKGHLQRILQATEKITEIHKHFIHLHNTRQKNTLRETVDVQWLLDDCLNIFYGLLAKENILLEKDYGEESLEISGNIFELQQAFRNLILNAIEAMAGQEHKLLKVGAGSEANSSEVMVRITDSGCGTVLSNEEFFNSGRTTKMNGSGLGLGVVRNVITGHGGRLHMSSRVGQGTVIAVTLPFTDRKADGGHTQQVALTPR